MAHNPTAEATEIELAQARSAAAARKRRWHRRRDVRFLFFAAVALLLYYGYGFVTGPWKLSEPLAAEMASADRVTIVVATPFAPEAFHMAIYQAAGRLAGTNGNFATIRDVPPAEVRALARKYWVSRIDLAPAARN